MTGPPQMLSSILNPSRDPLPTQQQPPCHTHAAVLAGLSAVLSESRWSCCHEHPHAGSGGALLSCSTCRRAGSVCEPFAHGTAAMGRAMHTAEERAPLLELVTQSHTSVRIADEPGVSGRGGAVKRRTLTVSVTPASQVTLDWCRPPSLCPPSHPWCSLTCAPLAWLPAQCRRHDLRRVQRSR